MIYLKNINILNVQTREEYHTDFSVDMRRRERSTMFRTTSGRYQHCITVLAAWRAAGSTIGIVHNNPRYR